MKNEIKTIIQNIEIALSNYQIEELYDLFFNELRENITQIDSMNENAIFAIKEIPKISKNDFFIETYFHAFLYFYSFSMRIKCGIFFNPASFGLKYKSTQMYFKNFLQSMRNNFCYCSDLRKIYFSVIIFNVKKSFSIIIDILNKNPKDIKIQKNATIAIIYLYLIDNNLKKEIKQNIINKIKVDNYKLLMLIYMKDIQCDLNFILSLNDEDEDLIFSQSFLSTIKNLAVFINHPNENSIDFIFTEINRLKNLPSLRGFEFEFDAYKCLNEDLALLLLNYKSSNKNLFDYFLNSAKNNQMQSHELLRKGIILNKDHHFIKIYDYLIL